MRLFAALTISGVLWVLGTAPAHAQSEIFLKDVNLSLIKISQTASSLRFYETTPKNDVVISIDGQEIGREVRLIPNQESDIKEIEFNRKILDARITHASLNIFSEKDSRGRDHFSLSLGPPTPPDFLNLPLQTTKIDIENEMRDYHCPYEGGCVGHLVTVKYMGLLIAESEFFDWTKADQADALFATLSKAWQKAVSARLKNADLSVGTGVDLSGNLAIKYR